MLQWDWHSRIYFVPQGSGCNRLWRGQTADKKLMQSSQVCLCLSNTMGNFQHIFHQACSHCLCSHSGVMVLETLFSAHESAAGTFHPQTRAAWLCLTASGTPFQRREKHHLLHKSETVGRRVVQWHYLLQRQVHDRVPSARSSRNFLHLYYSLLVSVLSACSCHGFVHKMCIPVTPICF